MDYYRKAVVCLDDYQSKIPQGRICYPGIEQAICFEGVMELMQGMEYIQELMGIAKTGVEYRTFGTVDHAAQKMTPVEMNAKGKMATFLLHIVGRNSCSWQVTIYWMEAEKEENFRSVLELLWLLNSALVCSEEKKGAGE